jgi:hypothetical protein
METSDMMLKGILKESRKAIIEQWLTDTLSDYQQGAARFFRKTADPFANPVGHAFARGAAGIFEYLLGEQPIESVRRDLDDIVKIRAVQDFSPSRALSFVFLLKKAVRAGLGEKIDDPGLTREVREFESGIDQLALLAFEAYVDCRERIGRLRVEETRRQVSVVMARFNRKGSRDKSTGPTSDEEQS